MQVVTPNQFELHAGSANKRPPDYIFLENGKSLRDIMTACKNANPKYLEVTILNAISSSTEKKLAFCVECKGAFIYRRFTFLISLNCNLKEFERTFPFRTYF